MTFGEANKIVVREEKLAKEAFGIEITQGLCRKCTRKNVCNMGCRYYGKIIKCNYFKAERS